MPRVESNTLFVLVRIKVWVTYFVYFCFLGGKGLLTGLPFIATFLEKQESLISVFQVASTNSSVGVASIL